MPECLTCPRLFGTVSALNQHMNAVDHWPECQTCSRTFTSHHAARQHMESVEHWAPRYECDYCTEDFSQMSEVQDHMDEEHRPRPTFECEACNNSYYTPQEARRHMDEEDHWRAHYCDYCDRGFQNENNLRMHINGSAHRANSILCPFCQKGYTTASGLAHHLETGSCPRARNINREVIHSIVRERDISSTITNKQLEWHSHANESFVASSASWNGSSYECYLCHRSFRALQSLNQHLNSPVHKQRIYHCFGRTCSREFPTLAALFGHLESEACGATRFETVQRNVGNVFSGRMLTF